MLFMYTAKTGFNFRIHNGNKSKQFINLWVSKKQLLNQKSKHTFPPSSGTGECRAQRAAWTTGCPWSAAGLALSTNPSASGPPPTNSLRFWSAAQCRTQSAGFWSGWPRSVVVDCRNFRVFQRTIHFAKFARNLLLFQVCTTSGSVMPCKRAWSSIKSNMYLTGAGSTQPR